MRSKSKQGKARRVHDAQDSQAIPAADESDRNGGDIYTCFISGGDKTPTSTGEGKKETCLGGSPISFRDKRSARMRTCAMRKVPYGTSHTARKTRKRVLNGDAAGCCAQGLEFECDGDLKYPDDFPKPQTIIYVEGTLGTYEEDGVRYVRLDDAKLSLTKE